MQFNKVLDDVKIYEAGKPIELVIREYGVDAKDIIKLASNENPYGTSPKVTKKIQDIAKNMFMYPDDSMFELKEALASKFKVESSNIIIGSGSDQILEFAIHAKCDENSKLLMSNVTFAMYEIYGKQMGAKVIRTEDDEHNLDQFRKLYKEHKPDMVFLCLPNNPLGECLDTKDVYSFLEEIDEKTLVVVDGAYHEYAAFKDENKTIVVDELISKFPNVIYLGTFSKAYALGGMRVGYGIAKKEIIQNLYKLRPPFNITTLSLAAAIEALKDEEFVIDCIRKNFEQMKRYEDYAKTKGFSFIESYTNFITIKFDNIYNSSEVAQNLLQEGIIVRDLKSYNLNAIRITIGSDEQNTRVLKVLDEVLKNLK